MQLVSYKKESLFALLVITSLSASLLAQAKIEQHIEPPGIVIDKSPDPDSVYVGCPSIVILPNGNYVASHSWFGPATLENETVIFRSADEGKHWQKLCKLTGQCWSTLFIVDKSLYIMGVSGSYGNVVIRKSEDGGNTWTTPKTDRTGLLLTGSRFHSAPVPVVMHKGRIWRACEDNTGDWGKGFRAFMMSAPHGSDLLQADNWTVSEKISWGDWEPYSGFLEGNAVVTPEGKIVNILRVHEPKRGEKAAMIEVSSDGKNLTFDPENGFIDFPGGCKKFTIRYDEKSGLYWSLTNWAQDMDRDRAVNVERQRNTLALISSANLRAWEVRSIILYHPDVRNVGFQYADWQFEGDDIIAISRTAFGNAKNCHNANYMTFHRIRNFRKRTMDDKPLNAQLDSQSATPDDAKDRTTEPSFYCGTKLYN